MTESTNSQSDCGPMLGDDGEDRIDAKSGGRESRRPGSGGAGEPHQRGAA